MCDGCHIPFKPTSATLNERSIRLLGPSASTEAGLFSKMERIGMGSTENAQTLINQSLRGRIMATYALCAVAEDEVHAGQLDRTLQTVKAIRRMLSDINVLVCGPTDRLSPSVIHEAADMLAELESRTQAIEQAIGPSPRLH